MADGDFFEERDYRDGNPPIIKLREPVGYDCVCEALEIYKSRYAFFDCIEIGTTIRGRSIHCVRLGDPAAAPVLYVGAHHGMEWITSALLLRFINEYCEYYKRGRRMYGLNMSYLYANRCIYVVPMLNCDGVDIQQNGASKQSPLYNRLISMNGGSEDFHKWQANERGVDLNHNYNAGFHEYKRIELENNIIGGAPTKYSGEYPESEPETSALTSLFKTILPTITLSLHTQGEEIYYSSGDMVPPKSRQIGRIISDLTGYKLSSPSGSACYGGLLDWIISEYNLPAFTIECGRGENPLPYRDFLSIYSSVRELFFTAPVLI